MINPDLYPDHWQLGCSDAKRWLNCPGSKFAVDDREPELEARAGTLGHKVAEHILRGESLTLTEADRTLLHDELQRSQREWLKAAIRECVEHVQMVLDTGERHAYLLEAKLPSTRIPNHGGTTDVAVYWPDQRELDVIDLKFGAIYVDPVENDQLAAYINLARQVWPQAERFFGTIVQPTFRGAKRVEYSKEWLDEWLVRAAVAADPENTELNASPEWCMYCPLLVSCKEAAKLGKRAAIEFDGIKQEALSVGVTPTPELIEQVETILQVNKMVAKATDLAGTLLKTWYNNGQRLGKHKVTNTTRRYWDQENDFSELAADYPDVFATLPKGSPADVQKALGVSKQELADLFGSVIACTTTQVLRAGKKPDASILDDFD